MKRTPNVNSSSQNRLLSIKGFHPNIWPPFTQIASSKPPLKIQSGDGALLYREDGSTIIDGISSWWVTLHGHANPYIANAIFEQASQLEQVIFADFIHPQAELLSERLKNITNLDRKYRCL